MDRGSWRDVDAYLPVLAKSLPSLRVVFRVGFEDDEGDDVRKIVEEHLPLASNKGIVRIERILL
jgi:hypothetical protein